MFSLSNCTKVLPAILGKRKAWREIQNLYMRFVDPKSEVSAPMYCFEGSTLCYVLHVRLDPRIDQPSSINLGKYGPSLSKIFHFLFHVFLLLFVCFEKLEIEQ